MARRWLPCLAVLLALGGCAYPVRDEVDRTVCDLVSHPLDPEPLPAPQPPRVMPPAQAKRPAGDSPTGDIQQTSAQAPAAGPTPGGPAGQPARPFEVPPEIRIPPEIPGSAVPPLAIPPLTETNRAEREAAIQRYFPPLPALAPDPEPVPGPNGQPLTLTDLQQQAMATSPAIREAAADLKAAQGAALQAGLYPNPTVGYEEDTANDGGTAGFQGSFIEQVIKTGGKLKLAQAAAEMDVRNARLALRAARSTVAGQVRTGYFNVLVAQEAVKVNRALVRFTDAVYGKELANLTLGQVAPFEPLPFRVLAVTARTNLVQSLNRYYSAWHQLAAAVGRPDMPPTQLAGRPDMPIPVYQYDRIKDLVLTRHTDLLTAVNSTQKARYNLRLAQVTPVSDVDVRAVVQKDFTTPPFLIAHTLTVGVTLPVWDRNQGNIIQAQAQLLHALEDVHRARDDLSTRLADAFERYENNRILFEYYRDYLLPDQVRLYTLLILRYRVEGAGLSFVDVSTVQTNLSTAVATYLTTLAALWTAVSDVGTLLQTDDLFQVAAGQCPAPIPDLEHLDQLPCTHPCSPLPLPIKGANGTWPPAVLPKDWPIMPRTTDGGPPVKAPELRLELPPAAQEEGPSFPLPAPGGAAEEAAPPQFPGELPMPEMPTLPMPRPVPCAEPH